MSQSLHASIGDFMREIDKIKAGRGPAKKLSSNARLKRIAMIRSQIRKVVVTLQKGAW